MKRPLAYITASWSNSQYENAENAAAYCRQVYDAGYSPICPVLFLPTFLKDEIPQEHKDGLDMARDYLRRSHVLVVCGHGIDETVKNDIATAEHLRITATTLDGILTVKGQSQLKAIYKDNADTIIGNMDTSIFLGGKEPTTLKELAAVLGKETIDTYNTGESRGRETSHSLNNQKLGKELMSQDELAVMDGGKCILQLRGVRPFLSDKYDITKHPNYPYTADADPKNAFDIEAFLSTRLKLKPYEVYDVYEVDAEGA